MTFQSILSLVRSKIFEQTNEFRPEDVIPVPCHPDSLAMAYTLKVDGKVVPFTRFVEPDLLLNAVRDTIVYEEQPGARDCLFKLFASNHSPQSGAESQRELLCCLPKISAPAALSYKNIFRVPIVQFLDAHAFDVRSVKKTCIHIVHPDGRLSFLPRPIGTNAVSSAARLLDTLGPDNHQPPGMTAPWMTKNPIRRRH